MLRLRSHLLSAARAVSPLPAASSCLLHRLFLCTTTTTPASQFVVEDYLTTSCGLTLSKARNVSRYLAHLKSPANPDAVRAFLAGIGVTKADLASAIAKDPRILCSRVDKTLTPRIAQLRDLGLTPPQISSLIAIAPSVSRNQCMIRSLGFFLSVVGSYERLQTALRRDRYLLCYSLDRSVECIAFLRQSGLTDSDISKLVVLAPQMFPLNIGRVKEIILCADMLGVPRNSKMFAHALAAIYGVSPRKINTRLDFLKKALGCTEAELGIAVCKLPNVLIFSEGRMSRVVDFLKMEVGLGPEYIVRRPALLKYSISRRIMPRHYVLKALKAKGLVEKDVDFFNVITPAEEIFRKRFLDPYKDSFPGLADSYATACARQVPPVIQT